jgi:hypothetical protein
MAKSAHIYFFAGAFAEILKCHAKGADRRSAWFALHAVKPSAGTKA